MDKPLYTIDVQQLNELTEIVKKNTIESLEKGSIVYFPNYSFTTKLNQQALLSESILEPKRKNISYDYQKKQLTGLVKQPYLSDLPQKTMDFMHHFAEFSKTLIDTVLPQYSNSLRWGRTSYRPAEIKGRKTSKRKDDTRLHVDSFAATPVYGQRILRVFCNINPYGDARVWHVGEPFSHVLNQFSSQIPLFNNQRAKFLNWIRSTKTLRSPYDHYMLHLHDKMKLDDHYQQKVNKQRIDFLPQTTWIVFTDHVSHAALSGQFLLEQTFYLPVSAMANTAFSPLKQWEKIKAQALV